MRQIRGVDVAIESPSETAGDPVVTWTTIATVRSLIQGLTMQERELFAEADYRFPIAYRTDVTPRQRLGLVGTLRKFAITSVLDQTGQQKELMIFARELS
ncbi:MAG: head-tail adaptor protein [bacterium]